MAEGVRIERDGAIQVLRFDRAEKKNAITSAMYDALADALEQANGDPDIGVCMFLGAPGVFTAGNDLGDFMRAEADGQGLAAILRFLRALATCDRPLFAGVDGLAVGVGATLLLHCDYVLATERTVLRTPFTSLGLVPEAASSLLGPRLLGHARAFELLVMGRDMDGATACRCGIVNNIVEPDELEGAILSAARELAAKPREAVLASRRLLRGDPADVLARIGAEAEEFAGRLVSGEAQAAFAAFMGKQALWVEYEWDDVKAAASLEKHGVPFERVLDADWNKGYIFEDNRLDYGERRFVGYAPIGGRLHVVVYTVRGTRRRVISLRKANAREYVRYRNAQEA